MKIEELSTPMVRVSDIKCPHCDANHASAQVNKTQPLILHCSNENGSCGQYFVIKAESWVKVELAKVGDFN